jgi:hypothetical protein
MSDETNKPGAFSEDYVKELREEAAKWRIKCRELEAKASVGDVAMELVKRGIKADPSWIKRQDGQKAGEAVEQFLQDYPQFVTTDDNALIETPILSNRDATPRPMPTGSKNPNTPGPKPANYGGRSLDEIKVDPQARAALRSQYRQLLAQSSHKEYEGE